MDARTCRKCGETKPVSEFPEYVARGRVYRRHSCYVCMLTVVSTWKAQKSRARHQERLEMLRSLITALRNDGLNNTQIADMAGLSRTTVKRIVNGTEGRVRFQEPVEEKIVDLYSELRGIA